LDPWECPPTTTKEKICPDGELSFPFKRIVGEALGCYCGVDIVHITMDRGEKPTLETEKNGPFTVSDGSSDK